MSEGRPVGSSGDGPVEEIRLLAGRFEDWALLLPVGMDQDVTEGTAMDKAILSWVDTISQLMTRLVAMTTDNVIASLWETPSRILTHVEIVKMVQDLLNLGLQVVWLRAVAALGGPLLDVGVAGHGLSSIDSVTTTAKLVDDRSVIARARVTSHWTKAVSAVTLITSIVTLGVHDDGENDGAVTGEVLAATVGSLLGYMQGENSEMNRSPKSNFHSRGCHLDTHLGLSWQLSTPVTSTR